MTIPATIDVHMDPLCNCKGCIDKVKKALETSHVPHVDDIATTLMTMSHIQGLKSMEYTQSNTFKFNFTNGHNQPTLSDVSHKLHNIRGSDGVHLESYDPLPPPPPPQTNVTPSAPPIPTIPDLVYGYPSEFYDNNINHPDGCYTVLLAIIICFVIFHLVTFVYESLAISFL
ncbi:hypothetical protein HanRHA438_Chr14g0675381 [Helianthus annuus]|nr:hypothetical protein HanRHA438_Chr14g0675381 [Helianthus annuus]